eukprot:4981818-Alexandrium_andersonii.AAC.1
MCIRDRPQSMKARSHASANTPSGVARIMGARSTVPSPACKTQRRAGTTGRIGWQSPCTAPRPAATAASSTAPLRAETPFGRADRGNA